MFFRCKRDFMSFGRWFRCGHNGVPVAAGMLPADESHKPEGDCVVALHDTPQSSVGAPCPIVVADETQVFLFYYAVNRSPDWDGRSVRVVETHTETEPSVKVFFRRPLAHFFGPPNDEAFAGHPLASRGLLPYGIFRIDQSSWIEELRKRNSVHPSHSDTRYERYRHYIFTFHDSIFECVSEGYEWSWGSGSLAMQARNAFED